MKNKQDNFQNNISRLVKLTRQSDAPSEQFVNNLIHNAVSMIDDPHQTIQSDERNTAMKFKLFHICAIAAVLTVISALAISYYNFNNNLKYKVKDAVSQSPEEQSALNNPIAISKEMPVADKKTTTRSKDGRTQQIAFDSSSGTDLLGDYYSSPRSIDKILSPMAHGGTTPPNGEDVDAMFFENYGVNPFVDTDDDHLSTFAADVDSASYTLVRSFLMDGNIPPKDAVRVEEFVNYFDYHYPAPLYDTFAYYTEACRWPFAQTRNNTYLMRIGLKAYEIDESSRKPAILTFVIDISGSMNNENRLGLVKKSLLMLVDRLKPDDQIGIAVYGSQGQKIMDHTGLQNKQIIIDSINSLVSEGSTNAEEGIRIGYEMADAAFQPGCINRVILCSDGVANVGKTGPDEILEIIKEKASKGITLSTLGFGMGNYNDVLMEQLGNKGDGYYSYVDTIDQAERLFGQNLTGTLQVAARDVKLQVDFNPDVVRSYRLIGYENRNVADEDFRNDTVDGGEVGTGHSATALYEVKLWPDAAGLIATTYVRYKNPDTMEPEEYAVDFTSDQITDSIANCSDSFKLAAAAGQFAEVLRESYWAQEDTLEEVIKFAQSAAQTQTFTDNADVKQLIDMITKAIDALNKQQEQPEDTTEITTD